MRLFVCFAALSLFAQKVPDVTPTALRQVNDEAYGRLIHLHLQDARISTELVDHLPASSSVPTPLKFFGRIPGTPGELTYAIDIQRYYQRLAQTSPRARLLPLGSTEEGRQMIALAISDEHTIDKLDEAHAALAALGDPRKTRESDAASLIKTAKPVYWITSGIHSSELGGPEMLIELAYRLIVEETPFIRTIREHSIVMITPVLEVDGREKAVDTYYYGKRTGKPKPPLMYWGRYVAHDNNRDGMGQFLQLTQNATRFLLDWHPTVLHDLHEAQSYLYTSTGTGPYNPGLDPLQVSEWWLLAQHEITEMTRRNVPGVWTYGFYDGWVPNYLFWIAVTHNSFGRFYEVQSYGPEVQKALRLPPALTSHEWYRPNPPLPSIGWGPRNTVNIQESALLFALHEVAEQHEFYLQNYWDKTRRSIDKGRSAPPFAWLVPREQHTRANAIDMINDLRHQGLEVQRIDEPFTAGKLQLNTGDYLIRADQPYRELADMYFATQSYAVTNPKPYDDTGWTMPLMRNIKLRPVNDRSVLDASTTLVETDIDAPGSILGSGNVIAVDHTGDNVLMRMRMNFANTRMLAAESEFQAAGHTFAPGTFLIPEIDRTAFDSFALKNGLVAYALENLPPVKTHELDVPRIAVMHSWQHTQDEGWVRATFDRYQVPYTYLADTKARGGRLRERFDVIVYPHIGGTPQSQIAGIPRIGPDPIPYRQSDITPHLGTLDSSDDIRGGIGLDGLSELEKFVSQGGTLMVEGSTAALAAEFGIAPGIAIESPEQLQIHGSILRGIFNDRKSPILYGYEGRELPVYFGVEPVLALPKAPAYSNERLNTLPESPRPRVVLQTPSDSENILLSGMLGGAQSMVNHPLVLDSAVGKGHVVLFAIRPFWRWQTQGTFFLGFNAILNWNDLDTGKPE